MSDEERGRAWLQQRLGCDHATLDRIARLVAALILENGKQNLVASASLREVWWRHVVDSAQLLAVSRETEQSAGLWLDLGSGAGFPGLIIAALAPTREVHLIEQRRQRIAWLEHATTLLNLRNASVRGESLARTPTVGAGVISARAFAPLPKLVAMAARFSTPETLWLLPKGERARQEVDNLPTKLRAMFHVEPSATNAAAGIVVGRGAVEIKGVRAC